MLKKIFILISLHLCIKCHTQSNDPSLIFYNQGIVAYQKNQFAKADSFYTLSLKLRPDADTYFNRAMSRLKLINATGYYEDLICAGSLGDKESDDLLHSHARTIDTLRYSTTCVIGNDSSTNAYIYITYTLRDMDTKLELKYDARKILLNISWFKEIQPDTSVAEQNAEYRGGFKAMMTFIQKNMVYPKDARDNSISGKVFLKFVVNTTGCIERIVVLKGIAGFSSCDEEAIRLLNLTPRWKPARLKGKAVKTYFTLPFTFKVQ